VNQVATSVIDPETKVPVATRLRAYMRVQGQSPDASAREVANAKIAGEAGHDLPIAPLGSGSDFSSFLQHLGLPALDFGYGGEGEAGGVYHSAYDTWEHHSRFVDPGFVYDALLAKTVGHTVLRLADAPLPQQRAGDFADAVSEYVAEVKHLADSERHDADSRDALLRDHVYQLAADPAHPEQPPASLSAVPFLEFASLDNAALHLREAAHAYDAALAHGGAALPPERQAKLRSLMLTIDQTLAPESGLPGRPWYKNLIFAPGRFTGYQAKTLPAVREAIEERRWSDADKYARITASALDAYSARLEAAKAVLEEK
jgi:N-acetylated-alpha-linked acidic dipeptidase